MKKYIIVATFLLFTPFASYAQVSQEQYNALLQSLIALLTQEVAQLQAQLTMLIAQQAIMTTPPATTTALATPIEPVVSCIENPVLTLNFATTSEEMGNYSGNYSTGCPLDLNMTYSYMNAAGGDEPRKITEHPRLWYVDTSISNNVFHFGDYHEWIGHHFSITVGSTTKSL